MVRVSTLRGGGTYHPGITAQQDGLVTRNRPDSITVEGPEGAKEQDNVRAVAGNGCPLNNAHPTPMVCDESRRGIALDGQVPGRKYD